MGRFMVITKWCGYKWFEIKRKSLHKKQKFLGNKRANSAI